MLRESWGLRTRFGLLDSRDKIKKPEKIKKVKISENSENLTEDENLEKIEDLKIENEKKEKMAKLDLRKKRPKIVKKTLTEIFRENLNSDKKSNSVSLMNEIKKDEENQIKNDRIANLLRIRKEKIRNFNRYKKSLALAKIFLTKAKNDILEQNIFLKIYYASLNQIGKYEYVRSLKIIFIYFVFWFIYLFTVMTVNFIIYNTIAFCFSTENDDISFHLNLKLVSSLILIYILILFFSYFLGNNKNSVNTTLDAISSKDENELNIVKKIDHQIGIFENFFDRGHEVKKKVEF